MKKDFWAIRVIAAPGAKRQSFVKPCADARKLPKTVDHWLRQTWVQRVEVIRYAPTDDVMVFYAVEGS